jgi:hypothetical protein
LNAEVRAAGKSAVRRLDRSARSLAGGAGVASRRAQASVRRNGPHDRSTKQGHSESMRWLSNMPLQPSHSAVTRLAWASRAPAGGRLNGGVRRLSENPRARLGYALLALTSTLLLACGLIDPCGNEVISEVSSPNGEYRAIVFERDCGATTDFSTQVSVLRKSESFRAKHTWYASSSQANCFTCDSDHGKASAGPAGGPWVWVRWLSPDRLELSYDGYARVFLRQATVSGVRVTYVPAAAPLPTPRESGDSRHGV